MIPATRFLNKSPLKNFIPLTCIKYKWQQKRKPQYIISDEWQETDSLWWVHRPGLLINYFSQKALSQEPCSWNTQSFSDSINKKLLSRKKLTFSAGQCTSLNNADILWPLKLSTWLYYSANWLYKMTKLTWFKVVNLLLCSLNQHIK